MYDHRWILKRQPLRKLCFYCTIRSGNTVFFFQFYAHCARAWPDSISILVHWGRFLINRENSKVEFTYFKSEVGRIFMNLKTNLLHRVLYIFSLLKRETITSQLNCTLILVTSTKPGFQLHQVQAIMFSLELPLNNRCFFTLLYCDVLILKRELGKNIQNSINGVFQHLVWICMIVFPVYTTLELDGIFLILREKKTNWTRKVYKFSDEMIYDSFEGIYSWEAVLRCDRLQNYSTICFFKLSLKEDSGWSFSSEETCATFFASGLYPVYRTENALHPFSLSVYNCDTCEILLDQRLGFVKLWSVKITQSFTESFVFINI